MKTVVECLASLLAAATLVAAGANIEFWSGSNCGGTNVGSCAFGGIACCTWNSYVGSIAYSNNGEGLDVTFFYGSDVCIPGEPQGTYQGARVDSSGCWNVGNSMGQVTETCEDCTPPPCDECG